MAQTIHVQAGPNAGRRVALWERSPDHPGGEVYVAGRRVVEVAVTQEVARRLANKTLVEVQAPESTAAEPEQLQQTAPQEPSTGDDGSATPEDTATWPEGVTEAQIASLAGAGYDTLEKIRVATDEELAVVEGIGPATIAKFRQPVTPVTGPSTVTPQ